MIDVINRQIATLSPRTIYALIILGFLLGIVGIFNLSDHTAVLKAERAGLERRLAQYGDGLDEALWRSRAEETDAINESLNQFFWQGPTPGIISAQISSQLSAVATRSLMNNIQPDVPPDVLELPGDIKALRFQLTARTDEAVRALKVLSDLSSNQPMLTINELTVNVNSNSSANLVIAGIARFNIGESVSRSSRNQSQRRQRNQNGRTGAGPESPNQTISAPSAARPAQTSGATARNAEATRRIGDGGFVGLTDEAREELLKQAEELDKLLGNNEQATQPENPQEEE